MTPQATFVVPPGATAQVYIIDSKVRVHGMPTAMLLTPPMNQLDTLPPMASWCFLVQSSKGEKILFDLALPRDLASYTPASQKIWSHPAITVERGEDVADVIKENGIDPAEIGSVIWRYVELMVCICAHLVLRTEK